MVTILAFLLLAAPVDTTAPAAYYIDSVKVEHFKDYYFSPEDIQSLQVDNKDSDTAAHTHGRIYFNMKPGRLDFKTLTEVCSQQEKSIAGLPVIYLIDGTVIRDPPAVRIRPDYISSIEVVKSTDIPSAREKKAPLALVLISTTHLRPKPMPGAVILR
jgi:hypothetical protein